MQFQRSYNDMIGQRNGKSTEKYRKIQKSTVNYTLILVDNFKSFDVNWLEIWQKQKNILKKALI